MLLFNNSLALVCPMTVALVTGQDNVGVVPACITVLIVVIELLIAVTNVCELATELIATIDEPRLVNAPAISVVLRSVFAVEKACPTLTL